MRTAVIKTVGLAQFGDGRIFHSAQNKLLRRLLPPVSTHGPYARHDYAVRPVGLDMGAQCPRCQAPLRREVWWSDNVWTCAAFFCICSPWLRRADIFLNIWEGNAWPYRTDATGHQWAVDPEDALFKYSRAIEAARVTYYLTKKGLLPVWRARLASVVQWRKS